MLSFDKADSVTEFKLGTGRHLSRDEWLQLTSKDGISVVSNVRIGSSLKDGLFVSDQRKKIKYLIHTAESEALREGIKEKAVGSLYEISELKFDEDEVRISFNFREFRADPSSLIDDNTYNGYPVIKAAQTAGHCTVYFEGYTCLGITLPQDGQDGRIYIVYIPSLDDILK
ncbi:hypothetical protein GCM10007047_30970 [Cerasicoccus arenae]|uniref:Uncharacterized protein n=2 Tax=Cerasicoccus arenae TaxID=424488 RepID=A0A8J3DIG1_9BACT|nr:hypothetical protein GCM10007047_30970 [Cerasicoccus arenae]